MPEDKARRLLYEAEIVRDPLAARAMAADYQAAVQQWAEGEGQAPKAVRGSVIDQAAGRFTPQDGDAWFARNRARLKAQLKDAVECDWPLRLIERNGLRPHTVIEFGCANGWRLSRIWRRVSGSVMIGIDISLAAIRDGQHCWPDLLLVHDTISTPLLTSGDLVIVSFVLHWIARDQLLTVLSNIDRSVDPGGYLLLQDFDPPKPVDVPYHHRPGVWTYKRDYSIPFLMAGYHEIDRRMVNHATGEAAVDTPQMPDSERAMCWLLRKGGA